MTFLNGGSELLRVEMLAYKGVSSPSLELCEQRLEDDWSERLRGGSDVEWVEGEAELCCPFQT